MDRITQNNLDHLVAKVTMHLTKMIEESLTGVDGIRIVSEKDVAGICNRALQETAVAKRVQLHASAWIEDAISYALQLAKANVSSKVQRAAKSSPRRGTPVF